MSPQPETAWFPRVTQQTMAHGTWPRFYGVSEFRTTNTRGKASSNSQNTYDMLVQGASQLILRYRARI